MPKLRIKKGTGSFVYAVTIPKDLIELLGWEKDDQIVMIPDKEDKDILVLKRFKGFK